VNDFFWEMPKKFGDQIVSFKPLFENNQILVTKFFNLGNDQKNLGNNTKKVIVVEIKPVSIQ